VLYAPLYLFLTTPVGNLLVNFSRDQDTHDETLPDALHYAAIYGILLLATTITVSTQIELFSVMAVGLFIVTALMLFAYLPTATRLKHLRNESAGTNPDLLVSSQVFCFTLCSCCGWSLH
jgi:ATP-binding cassette subfamily C (CFTR/MRP) protein 1